MLIKEVRLPLTLTVLVSALAAQTNSNQIPIGDPGLNNKNPSSTYATSNIDNVDLYNGSVTIAIPVLKVGGRGRAAFPIQVAAQNRWTVIPAPLGSDQSPNVAAQPIIYQDRYGVGSLSFQSKTYKIQTCPNQPNTKLASGPLVTYLVYTAADGSQANLFDTKFSGQPQTGSWQCGTSQFQGADRGRTFRSVDSRDLTFISDVDIYDAPPSSLPGVSGSLITKDGTRYKFTASNSFGPNSIQDRDGNTTVLQYTGTLSSNNSIANQVVNATDPLGRTTTVSYPIYSDASTATSTATDIVQYRGFGNTARSVTVNYARLSTVAQEALQSYYSLFPDLLDPANVVTYNPLVISSVVLPDGTTYLMGYNAYGEVTKLTLPTGGYITYRYLEANGQSNGNSGAVGLSGIVRRLQERDEFSDGSNLSSKTVYSVVYGTSDSNNPGRQTSTVTVDVQNAAGVLQREEIRYFWGNLRSIAPVRDYTAPFAYWWQGKEYRTTIGLAGSVNKTTQNTFCQRAFGTGENAWYDPASSTAPSHDTNICQVDTVLDGLTSSTSFTYDQYNNRTDEKVFDWNGGSQTGWLRETQTAYNAGAAYLAANIVGLPSEVKVLDSGSHVVSDTKFGYDEIALAATYSSQTGYTAPGGPRGDQTSKSACLLSGSTCSWLVTNYTFDNLGNVRSIVDPNRNQTALAYSDPQNSYAHLTTSAEPLGQNRSLTYDFYSGKITQSTDQNGVNTIYGYTDPSSGTADPLDRPRVMTAAAGTSSEDTTNFVYSSPNEINIYQGQNNSNDKYLRTQNIYDGFGRQLDSRTYISDSSYRSTPQTYDALGRIASATNELGYATTYSYDPLGRTASVQTPDSAVTSTSYSGKITTNTDAAGKQRKTTVDALGRLVNVVEDPSGLNYSTSYSYDSLDNLKTVAQAGETRTFNYDSLKRLSSSTNPETGTVSYTYDANGNLLTKKDNLSITTTSTYDSLNRLLTKTYSSGAPNVTYTYCNPSTCSTPYGRGRVQNVATSQGNSTSYGSFTPAGQVSASTQISGGKSYAFNYTYAPSGVLYGETYPSTRQVNYSYLYANRPQAINGSYTTAGTTTNNTYVAWMGWNGFTESSRSLGSLSAMVTDLRFNSREQLTQFNMLDWNHADNSPYYVQWQWFYNHGGTNNNGNLLSVAEYNSPSKISTPSYLITSPVTTSFTYDGLNRLAGVTDNSYSRSLCYDALGNSWITAYSGTPSVPGNTPKEIGGTCPAGTGATPYVTGTNKLAGVSYDGNGNESSFGGNTVNYDAEGRVVSVVNGSTTLVSYQYDGSGQRVQKTTPGGTTTYVYDASGALMAEYTGAALSKEYVRFHSSFIESSRDLVAIENAAGSGAPCTTCFVIPDYLGNVRMVADNAGHAVSRHDYLPFGEEASADGNRPAAAGFGLGDGASQRFTGKERDAESGLDWWSSRSYGSALGRFASPDGSGSGGASPDDPQSWNQYAYARNNPLLFTDPDGFSYQVCDPAGRCSKDSLSDDEFNSEKGAGQSNGEHFSNGAIYHYDSDGNRVDDGIYRQTDVDLSPGASNIIRNLGQNADAQQRFIRKFAAYSVLAGTGVAGGLQALEGGLTTLDSVAPYFRYTTGQLNQLIGNAQRELLKDFFGQGEQGALSRLENLDVPSGLTRQTLEAYKEAAVRVVQRGAGAPGFQVQSLRLQLVEKALSVIK